MANSYLNIITFLLITLFYYLTLKPSLPYSLYSNKDLYKDYISNNYMYLVIYFLLVLVVQFVVNSSIVASTCGGNIAENMGVAGVVTFLPWTLIFGVLIMILTIYPGFKSAFSDVVGYYYVSGNATKLLTELLINKEVDQKINQDPTMTEEKKKALENAADAIIKICGNTSILINQMVPSNFDSYWNILTPLMKDKYKTAGSELDKIKNELFELVVTRDNIGEAMWYIYTGLLLTSIVQLKLTTRGCSSNPKTMQANYQKFLDDESKAQTDKEKASTTYTVTN
jgi:hypothetical protein